jgi:hypothetical protein
MRQSCNGRIAMEICVSLSASKWRKYTHSTNAQADPNGERNPRLELYFVCRISGFGTTAPIGNEIEYEIEETVLIGLFSQ